MFDEQEYELTSAYSGMYFTPFDDLAREARLEDPSSIAYRIAELAEEEVFGCREEMIRLTNELEAVRGGLY